MSRVSRARQRASSTAVRGGLIAALLIAAGCASSADLDEAESQLEATQASLAEAESSLADAEARIEELDAASAASAAESDALTSRLQAAEQERDAVVAERDGAVARAEEAEAALQAIVDQLPAALPISVEDLDLVGTYDIDYFEAYCDSIPTCGESRPRGRVEIVQGQQGLELVAPGAFTAGLLRVNGALVAGTDSDTMLQCEGAPLLTRVSATLFGNQLTVAEDGSSEVTGLGASIFVEALEAGPCPGASLFFGAQLTRVP